MLPRAQGVTHVTVSRAYAGDRMVEFENLAEQQFDETELRAQIRKVVPAVKVAADKVPDLTKKTALEVAADTFETAVAPQDNRLHWAQQAVPACGALTKALAAADADLTEKQDQSLVAIESLAKAISGDKQALESARAFVIKWLPTLIYLDEYPDLHGHQNVAEFLDHRNKRQMTPADINFEKLCKVAGLDPVKLQELHAKNDDASAETRNQLANRAGAVVTEEIRRLWKDRSLKVRFNLDAHHFDTLVSDPNSKYDVEVNLNERSRGFQWFFSFYVTFAADTQGGNAANAILLLDEPGLYLHAKSQSDLLRHLDADFENQIVYTTHSPFMVPTHNLDAVRTVSIGEDVGTTVTNDPSGDARTLFPLQASLGYSLSQSLFIGPSNLVVEGVTDYWALSTISTYLRERGKTGLDPGLTLTPAGGAQKVPYMVALLVSEELNVLVLLDDEKDARATRDDFVKNKLLRENSVTYVSEAFTAPAPGEADTEDLLDPSVYEALVQTVYAKELSGKKLVLNPKIPRVAKRVEAALNDLGIEFHKTRPMRLLLDRMATAPDKILTPDSEARFERLFTVINERFKKRADAGKEPFQ
nr:AAA family ATPase [Solimonas flava]